ncbi:MAG: phospho-sugar mutase [Chlamydiota bacterium]
MTNMLEGTSFDEETNKNVQEWLDGDYDRETKKTIKKLLIENPQEIIDAFYTNLSFGTGGLRGIMGVGTNRMNQYTVRAATQGFANYLNKQQSEVKKHRIIISYDTRHNSLYFAQEAAKVLAANEIEVLIFEEFRPTPLVSFGCRMKDCSGAIMITASHNPPEYNGYKLYWNDGGQILPPHDIGIIDEVNAIHDLSMVKVAEGMDHRNIEVIGDEIEDAYYHFIHKLQNYPESNRKNGGQIKVVYSNIHGTGITMVPEALRCWGFTNLSLVEAQKDPDGEFPTVVYPNPEEPEALQLGVEQLLKFDSDIFLATDPDTDRVGVVVNHYGEAHALTGNQIACLCLEHICTALNSQGRLPERAAFIKTLVTSELFRTIAHSYGKPCFDVLTGFKYIAQLIKKWEEDNSPYQFIFGGEESYGYLIGTELRDKDAVSSCALIVEAALYAKLNDKTLIDMLHDIYQKYGVYEEKLQSLRFPETREGHQQMDRGMQKLFHSPPKDICGLDVVSISDYLKSEIKDVVSGTLIPIALPKTKLISFTLSDESVIHVRPSGTEPKIKIYCGVKKSKGRASVDDTLIICERHCQCLIQEMINFLSS